MASTRALWFHKASIWVLIFTFSLSNFSWALPSAINSVQTKQFEYSKQLGLQIPEAQGKIEEVFSGNPHSPTVVFIQDAHANPSAQKNIESLLIYLSKNYGFSHIGVEGADSEINPGFLELLPDPALNLKTARELLEEGRLSGAELFALEEKGKGHVIGIDDRNLYRTNLEDYRKIVEESAPVISILTRTKSYLKEKKRSVYDPRLRELEERKEFSRQSPQSIMSYAHDLAKLADRILGINLNDPSRQSGFSNVMRLVTLARTEKRSNINQSKKEIEQLKKELARSLRSGSEKDFILKYLGAEVYPKGARAYFEKLYSASNNTGITWQSYPQFRNFAATLIMKEELTGPRLFLEMDQIEKGIYQKLLTSEKAESIYVQSEVLELLTRVIQLEATRHDVEMLEKVLSTVSLEEVLAVISALRPEEVSRIQDILEKSLRFYEVAKQRDEHFVSKISELAKSKKLKRMAVVTGGFHREGITELLKKEGFSFCVISPEVGGGSENKYRELMTEKKIAGSLSLEAQTVDLAKIAAAQFLDQPGSLIDWVLRDVTLGSAFALDQSGQKAIPAWQAQVNNRLKNWFGLRHNSVGNIDAVELEAVTPWSKDAIELLFRIKTSESESWVSAYAIRSKETGDFSVEFAGPYPVVSASSLGSEYEAKKIVAKEPAKIAIYLGGPDYEVLAETEKFFLSSNFETDPTSNVYTSFNRMFDAFLRNIVGDPNISLTNIYGVKDPDRLFQLIRSNTFHGKFPAKVVLEEKDGSYSISINGQAIQIHKDIPSAREIKDSEIDYLIDLTNTDHTGEPADAQLNRLKNLQQKTGLKKVFVVNPQWDPTDHIAEPVIVGFNDDKLVEAHTPQVIPVATPVTQSTAHVLSLLQASLKDQIDYLSNVTVRHINQQGDRELHKIDVHGMGAALYDLFPSLKPNVSEGNPVSVFEAPIKGAGLVNIIVQLRSDSKIRAEIKSIAPKLGSEDKNEKKAAKEAKKKLIKGLNEVFKTAAQGPLKGLLRYGSIDEYLNSLKLLDDKSLVVLDAEETQISQDGQLLFKFWISDIGQGQALTELVKRALVKDQGEIAKERLDRMQKKFDSSGEREGTNVIPPTQLPQPKIFLKEGEKKIKYGIQGGRGRIGKYILRLLWDDPNYEPAFLNGVESIDNLVHQLNVDEVHGPYPFKAKSKVVDGKNILELIERETGKIRFEIPVYNIRQKSNSDQDVETFKNEIKKIVPKGVETVFNAAGVDLYIKNPFNDALQEAGVKRVILTAAKKAKEEELEKVHASVLFGVNNQEIKNAVEKNKGNLTVLSAVSCTTNGMGPGLAELLESQKPSVLDAYFLTEHGFTVSQGALFGAAVSGKSTRSANDPAMALLPEDSSANKAFSEAVPWMRGKIEGKSHRAANQDGSIVWTSVKLKLNSPDQAPTRDDINNFLKQVAEEKFPGIFGYEEIKNTSQLLGRTESSILDPTLTRVVVGKDSAVITIGEWYDNEGGYTQRVIDVEHYAAMAERGVVPEEVRKEEPEFMLSSVKLPGHQYLRADSREYTKIMSMIRWKKVKKLDVPMSRLAKDVLEIVQERRDPDVLKDKEKENFVKLITLLKAISEESVAPREPIKNPYFTDREIMDIEIRLVNLGDETSFQTPKGDRYFGISEYLEHDKKLILYFTEKFFFSHYEGKEKNTAAIQLVMMSLLQEVTGLSYPESLIAISNYNSKATQVEADGAAALPDLLKAMLDEMKKKAKSGDGQALEYLNGILKSEVTFVITTQIRKGLEKHGRSLDEIQAIQNKMNRIAFLINNYIRNPIAIREEQTKTGEWLTVVNRMKPSSAQKINFIKDDMSTEAPTPEMLKERSISRRVAVAIGLAAVSDGYRGASKRGMNGDLKTDTEKLLDTVAIQEATQALQSVGSKITVVASGGSVRDRARKRFLPGDQFGEGSHENFLLINPLEGKEALLKNEPGALSVAVTSAGESALIGKLPGLYVNAFVGHLSKDLSKDEISKIKASLEKNPIDPDNDPASIIKRWVKLNKKSMSDVVVHILDVAGQRRHEEERIRQLEDFKKSPEGAGLTIQKILSGTFESALKSDWGDNSGKLHIYLSTSGAAEIQTAAALAGKEHSYASFRLMSRFGLSRARDIRPENAYNFSMEEIKELQSIREDWADLLPPHPKNPSVHNKPTKIFTAGIVGKDTSGDFEATIVPVTDNKLLGLPGIKKIGDRQFEVTALRVVRHTDQHLYRWVERFRGQIDAIGGVKWTAVKAQEPQVTAESLGSPVRAAKNILLASPSLQIERANLRVASGEMIEFSEIFSAGILPPGFAAPVREARPQIQTNNRNDWRSPLFATEMEPSFTITVSNPDEEFSLGDPKFRQMIKNWLDRKPNSVQWFVHLGPESAGEAKIFQREFAKYGHRVRIESARNAGETVKKINQMLRSDLVTVARELRLPSSALLKHQTQVWKFTAVRASSNMLDQAAPFLPPQVQLVESLSANQFLRGKSKQVIGGAALLDTALAYYVALTSGDQAKLFKQLPDQSYALRGKRFVLETQALTEQLLSSLFTEWLTQAAVASAA